MTVNQIAYQTLKENQRSNLAHEDISRQTLEETKRSNRAKEYETHRANVAHENETWRSNTAKEIETHRSNHAKELETTRSNLAKETETNRSNQASESNKQAELNLKRDQLDLAEREFKQKKKQDTLSNMITVYSEANKAFNNALGTVAKLAPLF